MTEQETEAAPRTGWCRQHHQSRADCLPGDRHVQSFRGADELLDAVKAKAETMGLNRQDGIEMALEQFVGWHEPGEPWRGPRAVREPRGRWRVPAAAGRSEREVADRILQDMDARTKRQHPSAAPGSAVFREPGGKPVIAAAVPQVPASRSKSGRRS